MEPLTRKEFFLNAIAEGTPTPAPLTREERYLAKIAENTGGDSLPPIEEGDDGKLLGASDGEAAWVAGRGLPDITVLDDNKILTVDDGTPAWTNSGSLYPYDFVIKCLGSFKNFNLNQLNIVKGTLQDIEERVHEDQNPVTGCLIQYRQTNDPSLGYMIYEKYNLIYADVYYRYLVFASQRIKDTEGGGVFSLYYDEYYVINAFTWSEDV